MFRQLIIFTVLLSLTTVGGQTCIGGQLNKTQHQLGLLTTAHVNLQLRMDAKFERMDRRLTEMSNEIKRLSGATYEIINRLSGLANESKIRCSEILNETNSRLHGQANESKDLCGITKEIKSCPYGLANKSFKLPAENCANSGNEKSQKGAYPASCVKLAGGLQQIRIDRFSPDPFFVFCDNVTQCGGWTVIQRRMDGSVDFDRNWADYKQGFGDLAREFFIGLEKLHALTTTSANELLIIMSDKACIERFAKYDAFAIGGENEYYALSVLGNYSGDAGDNLSMQRSGRFYTKDNAGPQKCAMLYSGAWWEGDGNCWSSLNGKYGDDTWGKGVNWYSFRGHEHSLPYVQMMIRPKT